MRYLAHTVIALSIGSLVACTPEDNTPSICADLHGQRVALECVAIDIDTCSYVDPDSGEAFEAAWSATCPATHCASDYCLVYSD